MTSSEEKRIRELLKPEPRYSMRFSPSNTNFNFSAKRLRELITDNVVQLRGWDLPHAHGIENAQGYIFNAVDWGMHLEFWRFYKSGQFVMSSSFWDIRDEIQSQLRQQFDAYVTGTPEQKKEIKLVASLIGMIYSITEYYLFVSRLAKALDIVDFTIELSLHNIENVAIVPGELGIPWTALYRSAINDLRLKIPDSHEVVADPIAASAAALEEVFEVFQWNNSEGAIKHWQERFMAGRYAF